MGQTIGAGVIVQLLEARAVLDAHDRPDAEVALGAQQTRLGLVYQLGQPSYSSVTAGNFPALYASRVLVNSAFNFSSVVLSNALVSSSIAFLKSDLSA